MKMNPVVHFEMPYEDEKRVSDFYANVFGWPHRAMGSQVGNYVVVTTTDSDAKTGRPTKPGAINGGFFKKTKETGSSPSVVIAVDDIKEHVKKVTAAGGRILGEPMDIPGVGWYVSFIDTEGNRVSLLQPNM